MTTIWDSITIGTMGLPQRITMSAMTRSRALADGAPSPMAVVYYAQRMSLGATTSSSSTPSSQRAFPYWLRPRPTGSTPKAQGSMVAGEPVGTVRA